MLQMGGQLVFLFQDVMRCLFRYPIRFGLLVRQIEFIGAKSVPVVIITGGFIGAVFAAQCEFQFRALGMSSAVGPVVAIAMCRELGPVLCALMIAGRVGSAMAAELATMKITEQIDALRSLAVYPTEYLIVPRFLAMLISMPILAGLAITCGVGAGYLVAVHVLAVPGVYYWNNTEKYTHDKDIWIGLVKAFFFGIIILLVGCNKGLQAAQGAEGVGLATTEAVVDSFIIVLIANFFFTFLLNALL
jgi:phospholipid/cholesterol/gamma-HCH transport system permease protein